MARELTTDSLRRPGPDALAELPEAAAYNHAETRELATLDSPSVARRVRWEWLAFLVILTLGAGLRIAYLFEIREQPDFARPTIDAAFHDYWARGIATGEWTPREGFSDPGVRTSPFFRPPGYPYLLALVYRVFGDGYVAPRVVQTLLGLANILLAFLFARHWLGRAPALLAALGLSVYWPLIFFEAELQATTLFVFFWLLFLHALAWWFRQRSFAPAVVAGLVGGLASLVRPNFLAVVLLSLVWIGWLQRDREARRSGALAALGLILGTALAVAPATARNWVVSGSFVPISVNSGINLFIGNNPQADGFVASELPGLGSFGTSFDWPRIVRSLETRVGHELGDAAADAYFSREGIAFIVDNPGRFVGLTWKKALLFVGPAEVGHNKELHFEREHSALLSRLPGGFPLLLAFGTVGLAWLTFGAQRSRRGLAGLVAVSVAAYALSVLPFFAAARYRVPVVPGLLFFAAWAVVRFGSAVRRREWRVAVIATAAFAILYLGMNHPWVDYTPSAARWHYDRAVAYEGIAEPDRALEEYRLSVRADPTFFYTRYNYGHLYRSLGRTDEAIEQWRAALMARGNYAPTHYNLALAYLERNAPREALVHLRAALELQPRSAEYRTKLAEVLEQARVRGTLD